MEDLFNDQFDDQFECGEPQPFQKTEDSFVEPEEWTIITAMDRIVSKAKYSELTQQFWDTCKRPIEFLTKTLDMTKGQVLLLSVMVEMGEAVSWRALSRYFKCTRITVMSYTEDIDDLLKKRWIVRRRCYEMGGCYDGFALVYGVIKALRHNQPFVPEKVDGLTIQELVDRMESRIERNTRDYKNEFSDDQEWLKMICENNPQIPLCQKALKYTDINDMSLLLLEVINFGQYAESDEVGLSLSDIEGYFGECMEMFKLRDAMRKGSHILIEDGLIEQKCEGGLADIDRYVLTEQFKREYLENYIPSKSQCESENYNFGLKKNTAIPSKQMFYNPKEKVQIDRLSSLLQDDHLHSIQERMEKEGMRKGFACLFYGAPGTGKTETVLQLARETGRDIMQVDIAGMRDKYVGESEKNIKSVFSRYREVCRTSERMPILFFNEADALFNKRTENIRQAVDRMDNAMQNIILQEMENLEGILIATTNLTSNLDNAFERRFLFKVEFQKPNQEVKAQLWNTMLRGLTHQDAMFLASKYDFSGGQIENIARKRTIEYILTGHELGLDEIVQFCQNEQLERKNRPVGFSSVE